MSIDVIDLRSFYSSSLGEVARRVVHKIVRQRFSNCSGYSILGVGYATPYLEVFREEAVRVLAFMPAEQGVVNWPASGLSSSALVETTDMPLPNSCIDRALVIHALEITEHPRDLLAEIWRILTPGGRVIVVVPGRSGLWARLDRTPFGHGRPYSRGQLAELMRESLFSPTHWSEALYIPPFQRRTWLHAAAFVEDIARRPLLARRRRFDRRGNQALVPAQSRCAIPLAYAAQRRQPVLVPEAVGCLAQGGLPGAAPIERHRPEPRALLRLKPPSHQLRL